MKEKALQKERRKTYWQELERQRTELDARAKNSNQAGSTQEKEAILAHQDFVKQASEMEKSRESEKKQKAAIIMEENRKEKKRAELIVKDREVSENQSIMETLKRLNEEEEAKIREERNVKSKRTNALRESYAVQEEIKRRQKMQVRELDKLFKAKEEEQSVEDEKNRQRVYLLIIPLVL